MEMDTTVKHQRLAGAARAGSRRMGPISATNPTGAKASIPSRFETVLNPTGHEKHAFGRRTHRFNEPENDRPGPGAYHRGQAPANPRQTFSKNGSAAFASAKRAGFAEDAPPISTAPGPGAYFATDKGAAQNGKKSSGGGALSAGHSTTSVKGSAAFAEPMARRLLKVKLPAYEVPGPGAYAVETATSKPAPSAAFYARSIRDTDVVPAPSAGPGEFLPDSYINATAAAAAAHTGVSASNKSKTPRILDALAKKDYQRHVEAVKALPPTIAVETGGGAFGPSVSGPLPPILEDIALERAAEKQQRGGGGRLSPVRTPPPTKSAVFADTNLDRFGRPSVRYTATDDANVGPGSYEPDLNAKKPKRMLISSAWALSAVQREEPGTRWKVPGPAYYEVKPDVKKVSYHMLSKDYWAA